MLTVYSKKVLYAGKGDVPQYQDGTKFIFHYQAKTFADGADEAEIIDDSRKPYPHGYGEPVEVVLGKKFKVEAWEQCLKTMRLNEVASFTLPPQALLQYPFVSKQLRDISKNKQIPRYSGDEQPRAHTCGGMMAQMGMGYTELDKLMSKPQSLLFTFELVSVLQPSEYEASSWQLKDDEKMASIPELKMRGNDLFKEGKYAEACEAYGEALMRLDSVMLQERPGSDAWSDLDRQKVLFYLNIAQCKLLQQEYYDCLTACNEALQRDDVNEKALYRRAKAHGSVWNFDDAREDWNKLVMVNPSLAGMVKGELKKLSELQKIKDQENKDNLKGIFG